MLINLSRYQLLYNIKFNNKVIIDVMKEFLLPANYHDLADVPATVYNYIYLC